MGLVEKVMAGDIRAAARLMRGIEDGNMKSLEELSRLYPCTGSAYIVGITGASGVGKSTLVNKVISSLRQRHLTVGVIANDPSSPFTGGAILGDRVRMQKHICDQGVFIRSLATRGWSGGLARAAISMIHVMDAMHKDIIIVETIGVGQAETDVLRAVDTCILVLIPGMGDEIQVMKAGITEIADIFVINKADREGANSLKAELEALLEMKCYLPEDWRPAIAVTEALNGKGIDELVKEIFRHKQYLITSGEMKNRRKERARLELVDTIESTIKTYIEAEIDQEYLEKLIDSLVQRKTSPSAAAQEIIGRSIKGVHFK